MIFSRFKVRFRIKRYGIYILLGIYVVTFLYIANYTKPKDKSVSVSSETPHPDVSLSVNRGIVTPSSTTAKPSPSDSYKKVMAVLVLVCDRISVTRTLDQLLKYRSDSGLFPIILSQDCGENGERVTLLTREKYGKKIIYLKHPNYEEKRALLQDVPSHMKGYYSIAAHYGWALNYTFDKLGFDNVIIVEDDLDIAPDFFEYFESTLPLLYKDSSLWCVSAYNDNGKSQLIDMKSPELLYRTDFFPGLGWMLTKNIWMELSEKWPNSFWDDWMRLPEQRKDRSCIHPEISRTKTFGRFGVSNGQFFDLFLNSIKLNAAYVPFKKLNLSYLLKTKYDSTFLSRVEASVPVNSIEDFETAIQNTISDSQKSYKLTYTSPSDFKMIANRIGIMNDFKSGIPRGGYKGIVPVMFKQRRLYIVPFKQSEIKNI